MIRKCFKMGICLSVLTFFTVLGVAFANPQSVPPASIGLPDSMSPIIIFEATDYSFGEVVEGEKVTHVYKFHNAGDGMVLTIKKVQPTCGCTAALLTSDVIAPGGKGEIKVTFNSRGFHGSVHKTIRVKSDDPKNPLIELRLTGKVVKKEHISGATTGKKGSDEHISGN